MDRLRGELEGVLAWRVRGAVEWSSGGGLRPPGVVRSASEEYRSEQDRVGQFVGECCERDTDGAGWMEPLTDSGDLTGKGGLYPAFVGWCKEGGVFPMSKVRFVDEVLRVVGVGATVLRYSQDGNGKRRKAACVPGLRLLEP
jgi:putative DNA primase/helicase